MSWDCEQPSTADYSLYLSDFLSFHILNDDFFRQRFLGNRASSFEKMGVYRVTSVRPSFPLCKTMQARVVIFCMQVDNDVLYRVIANQPSHAYSSLYLYVFFFYSYFG